MADNQEVKPIVATAEETAEETAYSKMPTQEEVRADIVKEFGFDESTDKERIDKAVAREMKQLKVTHGAITAKIKHRTTANEVIAKLPKSKEGEGGGSGQTPAPKEELSYQDLYALSTAGVHVDDVDEVKKSAKLLGKSIPETLQDPIVKQILADKAEKRKTANATNIDPARPGGKTGPTDAEVVEDAKQGKIPKAGSPEAEQLFFARRGGKR